MGGRKKKKNPLSIKFHDNETTMAKRWSVLIADRTFSSLVILLSFLIISFAGMQMTIVLTLGLENPHTITRIPWQTKKQPGSITLTSHRCESRLYTMNGARKTSVIPSLRIHRDSLSFIYSIFHICYSYFDIFLLYLCKFEPTFRFNSSSLICNKHLFYC